MASRRWCLIFYEAARCGAMLLGNVVDALVLSGVVVWGNASLEGTGLSVFITLVSSMGGWTRLRASDGHLLLCTADSVFREHHKFGMIWEPMDHGHGWIRIGAFSPNLMFDQWAIATTWTHCIRHIVTEKQTPERHDSSWGFWLRLWWE